MATMKTDWKVTVRFNNYAPYVAFVYARGEKAARLAARSLAMDAMPYAGAPTSIVVTLDT